jgi:hypothetical protein
MKKNMGGFVIRTTVNRQNVGDSYLFVPGLFLVAFLLASFIRFIYLSDANGDAGDPKSWPTMTEFLRFETERWHPYDDGNPVRKQSR